MKMLLLPEPYTKWCKLLSTGRVRYVFKPTYKFTDVVPKTFPGVVEWGGGGGGRVRWS